jgi:putative membrane protein
MKKSTSIIVLVAAALIIQSCAGIIPMGGNGSVALDSVNTAGNNPVGRSNTPGTFRTGIYSQSSLATTATANTTGPSPSPEELVANSSSSAGNSAARSTKRFITEVALNNRSEVKLSTLALSRTKNSMVRSYASALLNNHDDMDKELKEMAVSKKVLLPGPDTADISEMMSKMTNMSDDQFDKEYMKMIIKDHRDVAGLFKQGTGLADPAVKAYAGKYLPIVKDQIKDASSLRSKLR